MKIHERISTLRRSRGWSQEELADRLDVSRQAVSKWESGGAMPEADKIIAMSEIFGVSTDYLLKDSGDDSASASGGFDKADAGVSSGDGASNKTDRQGGEAAWLFSDVGKQAREVTADDAEAALGCAQRRSWLIAAGVAICILSPLTLILLSLLSHIGEGASVAIGLSVLFVLIALAVGAFIYCGMQSSKYAFEPRDEHVLDAAAEKLVREYRERRLKTNTWLNVIGVALCIVGVIPLIVLTLLGGEQGAVTAVAIGLSVLFPVVAGGVFLMVFTGVRDGAAAALLSLGTDKRSDKLKESVEGLYWCAAVAIYLGWSFLSGRWDITWIVWPIAGVLSGFIENVIEIIRSKRK